MKNIQRPYIICHMMQTLDGKIASGVEGHEILMDYFDIYTATERELNGKAWMFGRKTAAAFAEDVGTQLPPSTTKIDTDTDFVAPYTGDTFAITVDTRGALRWSNNFINLSGQSSKYHLITLVTRSAPKEYLAYLKNKKISYIFAGKSRLDLPLALKKLTSLFGIQNILLEGGGSLNGSMMAAGVVDEISLLLIPRVLNKKDAPALFDLNTNTIEPKNYHFTSARQLDNGIVWLRYKYAQQ